MEENSVPGTEVKLEVPLKIQDADAGTNAHFAVYIKGNGSDLFAIDQKTFKISVKDGAVIDREYRDMYYLRLIARDRGNTLIIYYLTTLLGSILKHTLALLNAAEAHSKKYFTIISVLGNLSTEAKLTVHIQDANDHVPRFVQMVIHHREGVEVSPQRNRIRTPGRNNSETKEPFKDPPVIIVPETVAVGTLLIRLRANDEDIGDNAVVSYRILSETYIPESGTVTKKYTTPHFAIHPLTGEVSVANVLPPETDFILNVTATDKGGLEGHTSVKIHIKDVNNHAPHFEKAWYDFSIPEGVYRNHVLSQIQAVDEDFGANSNISYSIIQKRDNNADFPFKILSDGSLTVEGELDREMQEFYAFRIMAEDGAEKPLHTTVDVDVRVSDLNDNYPVFYNYDKLIQVRILKVITGVPKVWVARSMKNPKTEGGRLK